MHGVYAAEYFVAAGAAATHIMEDSLLQNIQLKNIKDIMQGQYGKRTAAQY